MGQVLHGSATTSEAVRHAIQHSRREHEAPPSEAHQKFVLWPVVR
jgi:hypothetical protein